MKLDFTAIRTVDDLELPALLFTPEKPTKKAALFLHGNGDGAVFYNPEHINAIADSLTKKGVAFLALNNRGAHLRKKVRLLDEQSQLENRNYLGGAHYEKIIDCIKDIEAAAAYLQREGYSELFIIGESTGANKIAAYHARAKHNPFSGYVLAGPGDDSGIYFSELGERRFRQAIAYAKQVLKKDKPLAVLPRYTGMYPFSAQAAFDMLDPDEPYNTFPYFEATQHRLGKKKLFGDYSTIELPMLVIFGEQDEYTFTAGGTQAALDLLKAHTNPKIRAKSTFTIVPEAGHSFRDYDTQYGDIVAEWLTKI